MIFLCNCGLGTHMNFTKPPFQLTATRTHLISLLSGARGYEQWLLGKTTRAPAPAAVTEDFGMTTFMNHLPDLF